jgi:hypothetical protein
MFSKKAPKDPKTKDHEKCNIKSLSNWITAMSSMKQFFKLAGYILVANLFILQEIVLILI